MSKFLSKTERVYLISVAAFTSLLCIVNISIKAIYPILYPPPFEIYDMARASLFPLFQLFLIPLPLFLLKASRFIVPGIFTVIALVPAYLQFGRAYSALLADFEYFNGYSSLRILLIVANPLDYATFVFGNLLFIWICSIVIRSFTATEVA